MDKLTKVFADIKKNHKAYALQRIIKNCVGPSTLRTLAPGTKSDIAKLLSNIEVHSMKAINSEEEFMDWFTEHVKLIGQHLKMKNRNTKRNASLTWGYGSKILALYLRDLFNCNQLVTSREAKKFTPWLYCPIDRIILRQIGKSPGINQNIKGILDIDSSEKFYKIQRHLKTHANAAKTHRVYFDDIWAVKNLQKDAYY